MKVALIHGQNHTSGSSCNIGRMVAHKVSDDVEEFFLPRDLDHHCTGCCACIKDETKCPFYEEKNVILDAIDEADLLIFTTPTYCMRCSGPMKAFIDLTFTRWMVHRPVESMFRKRALVISTAAGTGMKSAIKDITNTLSFWGISRIWKYGVSVQAMGWSEVTQAKKQRIEGDVARISSKILNSRTPKPSIKTRFLFNAMRMMQKKNMGSSPEERRYWEEKGWLGKKRPW